MDADQVSLTVPDVLLVEDDRAFAKIVSILLEGKGYRVTVAHSAAKAISLLESRYFPIILSDLYLEEESGLSLIPYTKIHKRPSFIIFLTGQGSITTTVKAIHEGAFAYLSKPRELEELEAELLSVIERAFKQLKILEQKIEVRVPSISSVSPSIIGKTPALLEIYRLIAKASLSRGNVIILGESGTGKELVAHAIHENSKWSKHPFVTINCSALTETLLESELFGHVKGAFTGALSNKRGLFEEANGGTLFLDEIGDVSPALQVKLLRAVQEGEIRPVGASENKKVDVRIVAATHRELEQQVSEGKFREDLYYRLKVFLIKVPALRDRMEDLPELVKYLISRAPKKDDQAISISEEAMDLLAAYRWPGNIRELENAIARAIAMSNTNILFPEDFPEEISSLKKSKQETVAVEPILSNKKHAPLEKLEHDHIVKVLESVNYNKSKTAEILGIDRGTLYRKALRYSIPLEHTND